MNSNGNGKRRMSLTTVAILVTWALTIIGAVWAASADRASLAGQVQFSAEQIADHEARLRTLERQTSQIAGDVRWIRRTLEQTQP